MKLGSRFGLSILVLVRSRPSDRDRQQLHSSAGDLIAPTYLPTLHCYPAGAAMVATGSKCPTWILTAMLALASPGLLTAQSTDVTPQSGPVTLSDVGMQPDPVTVADSEKTLAIAKRIDQWVWSSPWALSVAAQEDALLPRRLYLTLVGLPPTVDQQSRYIADESPDRFASEVDRLMNRPEFVEHWAEKLDVMLMERRPNTNIPQDEWTQWLRDRLSANQPLHELMADLLVADAIPGPDRPAARFLLDRGADPHLIMRDVGRIYFGRDLQCAQCHDHPAVEDYLQTDYHGLLGFVASLKSVEVTEGEKTLQVISEKSSSESPFESVFRRGTMHRVLPHLFGGDEFEQVWSVPGQDYHPAQRAGYPAQPRHSRRSQLAQAIRSGSVDAFTQNMANRLWAMVFGRGIVEPLDLHHAANPPLNGQLLQGVADQLRALNYDLRGFVRGLVSSETFRRGWIGQAGQSENDQQALATLQPQAQQQLSEIEPALSVLREKRTLLEAEYKSKLSGIATIQAERLAALGNVDTATTNATQAVDALNKAASEQLAAQQVVDKAHDSLAKLNTALASTSEALQAIGSDAELTGVVELLKSRVAAAEAALPPLEQALTDKSAPVPPLAAAVEATQAALQEAQAAADQCIARYQPAAHAVQEARLAWAAAQAEVSRAERIQQQVQSVTHWADLKQQINRASSQRDELNVVQQHLNEQWADLQQRSETAQQALTESQRAVDAAIAQQQTTRDTLAATSDRIKQIAMARQTLQSIGDLVASTDKIDPAIGELDAALAVLSASCAMSEKTLATQSAELETLQGTLASHQSVVSELLQQVASADQQIAAMATQRQDLERQIVDWEAQLVSTSSDIKNWLASEFLTAGLQPLMPEQLGWSFLAVNQVYRNYVDKHRGQLETESPSTPEQQQDPAFIAAREAMAVRRARAELQGNINHFVTLYGAGAGQPQTDFFATPDQALYASNGGALFSWAAASGDNVTARVVGSSDAAMAAEALYRGVLCRQPTDSEVTAVEQFLSHSPDQRSRLAQEMVWSLMAGAEFRFLR
ncbi:MAG: DUF1549 domain-containing protein [Pirellulaceae bacterium]|nr:DUF1549 domain-containing protein [Pirellulaceae bacterium]